MTVVAIGGIVTSTFQNMVVIPALFLKYGPQTHADEKRDLI